MHPLVTKTRESEEIEKNSTKEELCWDIIEENTTNAVKNLFYKVVSSFEYLRPISLGTFTNKSICILMHEIN
ncbi:hypothetical protein H5410_031463, partial [Solanum commersonii]